MYREPTVFFIEDDMAVRDAVSISLALADLNIEAYASGRAFLDAYTRERPGCLLMNFSLPEMDALTVQQELVKRNFFIPIILMIGIGMVRHYLSMLQAQFFCLLEKPFSRDLLLDSIYAAILHDSRRVGRA